MNQIEFFSNVVFAIAFISAICAIISGIGCAINKSYASELWLEAAERIQSKKLSKKYLKIFIPTLTIFVVTLTIQFTLGFKHEIKTSSQIILDNVQVEMNISGEIFSNKKADYFYNEIVIMAKKQIREKGDSFSLNNMEEISESVKTTFNSQKSSTRIKVLTIQISYPKDLQSLAVENAKQKLLIQRDSLISAAAKRDAEGYTPSSERLEERRDNRQLNIERMKSNGRIADRKAQALENAADNVGVFRSVSLTQ